MQLIYPSSLPDRSAEIQTTLPGCAVATLPILPIPNRSSPSSVCIYEEDHLDPTDSIRIIPCFFFFVARSRSLVLHAPLLLTCMSDPSNLGTPAALFLQLSTLAAPASFISAFRAAANQLYRRPSFSLSPPRLFSYFCLLSHINITHKPINLPRKPP